MQPEDKKTDSVSPSAGWVFHPGDSGQPVVPQVPDGAQPAEPVQTNTTDEVRWTASEYVAHERGASWYMLLGLGALGLAGLVYWLTRDFISSGVVIVIAIIFGVFATQRPRVLEYFVDSHGITIGAKNYPFEIFKSFSVNEEGNIHSLLLMPMKRFMPIITVYYEQKDEEKIIQKVADFLPFEEYRQDVVDNIMRKIRF